MAKEFYNKVASALVDSYVENHNILNKYTVEWSFSDFEDAMRQQAGFFLADSIRNNIISYVYTKDDIYNIISVTSEMIDKYFDGMNHVVLSIGIFRGKNYVLLAECPDSDVFDIDPRNTKTTKLVLAKDVGIDYQYYNVT